MTNFSRALRLLTVVASLAFALALPATSSADAGATSSGTVSLDQPAYTAHENQGYLTITIVRTGDLSVAEHVGYGVLRHDAQPGIDFDTIPNTMNPREVTVIVAVAILASLLGALVPAIRAARMHPIEALRWE